MPHTTCGTQPHHAALGVTDVSGRHGVCLVCGDHDPNRTVEPQEVICDRCHDSVPLSHTVETVRGSTICESCRGAFYSQCGGCDGWNRDGDRCGNNCCDPDSCDCDDCHPDSDYTDTDLSDLVHDYYFKPQPVFHGDGPLFLGCEIEIETPHDWERECAETAVSHLGSLGYLKCDSSITCGFEIVTHPMSYDWAIANFPWQMLGRLDEYGCDTTDSTGLHVHVSRAGFSSPCHIYRWMKFIYRNQPHVTKVARRSSAEWAAFTDDGRKAVKDYAKGFRGHDRHRAINTNNYDTFELRVFASSLNPGEVKAALGFTAASVEYTRHLSFRHVAHRGGWTWPAFTTWLDGQSAYQPLRDQLEVLQCAC